MNMFRLCASSALALCLCGLAAAQSNTGSASSTVYSAPLATSSQQQQSYNTATPGIQGIASASVVMYGSETEATAAGQVGQLEVSTYAYQPQTFDGSYADARAQAGVVDVTTITGPQAIGTPVNISITMLMRGGDIGNPDQPDDMAQVDGSLSYSDLTNGSTGIVSGSNNGAANGLQYLILNMSTSVGATVDLSYDIDAWSHVGGTGATTTQEIIFGISQFYTSASLPDVQIVSTTGFVYPVPTPPGFVALAMGFVGLALGKRSKRIRRGAGRR